MGPSEPTDQLPDIAVFWSSGTPAVRVDVFIAKVPFESEVVSTARTALLFGAQVPVARVEAMLVYTLLAGRTKDVVDVESIIATQLAAKAAIDWPLVERWATEWGIEDKVAALRATLPPSG